MLALADEEAGHLRRIAEDLLAELASHAAWGRDMLRARFQTLLLSLGRIARRQGVEVTPPSSSVARFQALIDTRLVLEAKRLLAHSDATTAKIAVALGFRDPAYFARFFRRHVRQPPSAFRAAIREKYQDHR